MFVLPPRAKHTSRSSLQNIHHSRHGRHFPRQALGPQQSQQARHHRALQHALQLGYVRAADHPEAWEHLVFWFIIFSLFFEREREERPSRDRKETIKETLDNGSDNGHSEWPCSVFFCQEWKIELEGKITSSRVALARLGWTSGWDVIRPDPDSRGRLRFRSRGYKFNVLDEEINTKTCTSSWWHSQLSHDFVLLLTKKPEFDCHHCPDTGSALKPLLQNLAAEFMTQSPNELSAWNAFVSAYFWLCRDWKSHNLAASLLRLGNVPWYLSDSFCTFFALRPWSESRLCNSHPVSWRTGQEASNSKHFVHKINPPKTSWLLINSCR